MIKFTQLVAAIANDSTNCTVFEYVYKVSVSK